MSDDIKPLNERPIEVQHCGSRYKLDFASATQVRVSRIDVHGVVRDIYFPESMLLEYATRYMKAYILRAIDRSTP